MVVLHLAGRGLPDVHDRAQAAMRLGDLVAVTHRAPPPAAPTAARPATPPATGAPAAASPTPPPERPSLSRSPARAARARSPPFPRHPAPRTGRHSPEVLADPRRVAGRAPAATRARLPQGATASAITAHAPTRHPPDGCEAIAAGG